MLADALALLQALSSLSPIGVIALLGVVIWMLVRNQRGQQQIADNHLHELPEMAQTLREIKSLLYEHGKALEYIKARINGGTR